MPGREILEFREKAGQVAKASIYDLRIHHDDVLLTILFRHWKLDRLTGPTEEAERARDGLLVYLSKHDATAKKYQEKRASAANA
jgi:acyl-[acyl-carrier-protein] desaturase